MPDTMRGREREKDRERVRERGRETERVRYIDRYIGQRLRALEWRVRDRWPVA